MDSDDRGPGFSLRKDDGSEEAFYPLALDADLAVDPQLVKLVTGTPYFRWAEETDKVMNDDPENPDPDLDEALAHVGLLAIAVRRMNPKWPVSKVRDFISKRGLDFEFDVGTDSEEEAEDSPPVEAGAEPAPTDTATSETSAAPSSPTPVLRSVTTQQKPSGDPGSETTAVSVHAI